MAASLEAHFRSSVETFDIGCIFYAKPTYILDPHNFYVLPLVHQNLLFEIQRPAGKHLLEELHVHKIVIYYSNALQGYIRGHIQHISDDGKCHMYALDNGFMESMVTVDRIFHPFNNAARHTQGLVRLCELDLCVPINRKFARDSIEAFRHFIGNEGVYVQVRGLRGEKLLVKLFNSYPEDIATLLTLNNFTATGRSLHYNIPQLAEWIHHRLHFGQTLNVKVQHGRSLHGFYVCKQEDFTDYINSRMDFSNYCESQPQIPYTEFVRGKPIGVMEVLGEPYERAIIVNVIDEGYRAKVKLIDWGRVFITEITKVKLIRAQALFATPARALYCVAQNSRTWNNGLPTFLYKGLDLTMTVEHPGRELEIPHVVTLALAPHNEY